MGCLVSQGEVRSICLAEGEKSAVCMVQPSRARGGAMPLCDYFIETTGLVLNWPFPRSIPRRADSGSIVTR